MVKAGEPKQYSISVPFLVVTIILGIIATGEVLYLVNRPSTQQANNPAKKVTPTVTPTPAPLFLNVSEPAKETKAVNGEILVEGETTPYTIVTLYGDTDDSLVASDEKGHFEGTVLVGDPGGTLGVSAFSMAGEEKSAYLFVGGEAVESSESAKPKTEKLGAVKLKELLAMPDAKPETWPVKEIEAKEMRRHAIVAPAGQVTQGVITLSSAPLEGIGKIYFDSKTVATATKTNASDTISIAPGYLVIAVGTLTADGIEATRIHVIPVVPTTFQQLPSFNASEGSSQGTINLNGEANFLQRGVLPTISLTTPTPSPTPMPVL